MAKYLLVENHCTRCLTRSWGTSCRARGTGVHSLRRRRPAVRLRAASSAPAVSFHAPHPQPPEWRIFCSVPLDATCGWAEIIRMRRRALLEHSINGVNNYSNLRTSCSRPDRHCKSDKASFPLRPLPRAEPGRTREGRGSELLLTGKVE